MQCLGLRHTFVFGQKQQHPTRSRPASSRPPAPERLLPSEQLSHKLLLEIAPEAETVHAKHAPPDIAEPVQTSTTPSTPYIASWTAKQSKRLRHLGGNAPCIAHRREKSFRGREASMQYICFTLQGLHTDTPTNDAEAHCTAAKNWVGNKAAELASSPASRLGRPDNVVGHHPSTVVHHGSLLPRSPRRRPKRASKTSRTDEFYRRRTISPLHFSMYKEAI